MNLKTISISVISILTLLSCNKNGQQADAQQQMPPQEFLSLVVNPQKADLYVDYPASVKGMEDIEIRPRIDGFIDAIYVDEGAFVRKGQTLFKINSPQSTQAVKTAQAAIYSAQAQVNDAEMNVTKTKPLVDKGIISSYQLQSAEFALESAKAQLVQAQTSLSNARSTLSWTNVTSPVDGRIGAIPFRLGTLVNSANALTTVANTSSVYAYYSLNEKDFMNFLNETSGNSQEEKIKNSEPVQLILANDSIYTHSGKITTINGQVNTATGSVTFRADFPNPDGFLRSGISGKIRQVVHYPEALVIPQKAVMEMQDKHMAYVIDSTNKVKQITLDVIPTPDGLNYVVTKGLKEGYKVVIEGIINLQNDMTIKPKYK